MVKIVGTTGGLVDLSFIPSLRCNLHCPHCMYDAGPNKFQVINIRKLEEFTDTIDWDKINSCGFYGGEPSIEKPLYTEVMGLIPINIKIWIITNGSWSRNEMSYYNFVDWAYKHSLQVFISSTPYHKQYQNVKAIEHLVKNTDWIEIKADDTKESLLPMGRNYKEGWTCSKKCKRSSTPLRYAVMPSGEIIYQNCDGIYPTVGHYSTPFDKVLQAEIKCKYRE